MDDGWETAHFGDLSHDGQADTDSDGLTDYQEFMAGTDPSVGGGGTASDLGLACAGGGETAGPALILLLAAASAALRAGARPAGTRGTGAASRADD
jgi:hypothetical protein